MKALKGNLPAIIIMSRSDATFLLHQLFYQNCKNFVMNMTESLESISSVHPRVLKAY